MFLATGDRDTLVYPANTEMLAKKLREAGVPVVEKHYRRAGHAMTLLPLSLPLRRALPLLPDVAEFLRCYLS